ncbi:MAG: amidohydrolase [Actinomycetota bacterium]|nr:amidohydrolase [Actinomycetota bacterium]
MDLDAWLIDHGGELIAVRRDLHAHPELGRSEHRTTALLMERLLAAGLAPRRLGCGTGLVCDVGSGPPLVVLRADIDALPLPDSKDVPYRSTTDGVCHACGHDVHTACLLGAGLALAAGSGDGTVRLVFQPAEELMPGGGLDVVGEGLVAGATAVFALHCDPTLEVGRLGVRSGPITAAADAITIELSGPGGHTSRPQNTVDLVNALATVAVGLPAALSRRVDPRAGMSVVWGHVAAGAAANAIPGEGILRGTLRVLDRAAWLLAPELVTELVGQLVAPSGAAVRVDYRRGVPPVVNHVGATALLAEAGAAALGAGSVVPTLQSMGGEDFAWYVDEAPGAMARLGVRPPGQSTPADLHQPQFDADERAIAVGVRVLVAAARLALEVPSTFL